MTKKEFSLIASALRTYYPREKLLPNEQAMELWYMQLGDLPYKALQMALNKWVATQKWSPSIAELRAAALELMQAEKNAESWADGWGEVVSAIRHMGMYREKEALESMSKTTRKTVELLGFTNLCTSENVTADRANFRMIYESLQEREKLERQLPLRLREQIENNRMLIEEKRRMGNE